MQRFRLPRKHHHQTLAVSLTATLVISALVAALPAHAQSAASTPPDPSAELRRQDERTQALRQREEASVEVKSPVVSVDTSQLPNSEAPCFRIEQLQINRADQSAVPAAAELTNPQGADFAWLPGALSGPQGDDSPIGKCLGAKGIALVLKRAQDGLLQRGLVTSRVLAQEQSLASGTLTLTLVPGYINTIRFKDGVRPGVRLGNTIPMHGGDLLNLRDVEQGLENLKRVPTAEADIQIEPAQDNTAPGQSDLLISYQQNAPVRLSMSVDDSGSKGTGVYQGSATVSLDNPLGLSDLLYFTANHDLGGGDPGARGTRGHILHYSLPMGYWLLGATYSSSRYYQDIAGLSQDYVYSGTSENTELKLSRLVYRDAVRKTSLSLKAWQRKSNNYIDDTEVQVQRRVVGGWELGLNHKDALGAATLEASLAYKRGTGDFDSIPAPEEAFGEGTSKFGLWTLDASASLPIQALGQSFKYNAALHVQDNSTPLTAQDRMAIGGRYSVRGFDGESSLAAERGWTLRNEFSVALGATGQEAYLGLDAGEVSGPSAERLLGNTLSGGVLGLRGSFRVSKGQLQYELFVGAPLSKPTGFRTAQTVAGFSLSLSF
jgi:hemolysin activation/secretion protein